MRFSLNGFIYRHIIDRILSMGQRHIIASLDLSDRVLDIACGTGSLSISMAAVAKGVTGIDLSEKMIDIAKDAAIKEGISNAEFLVSDASDLSSFKDNSFDKAVTSMAVHQFDPDLAVAILKEMKRIAGRVLIMDYYHPLSPGAARSIIYIIEWIAGGDHYRNFRNYNRLGGLDYFISEAGLTICDELYKSSSFRVAVCE